MLNLISYHKEEFLKGWIGNNSDEKTEEGGALLLGTTPAFFENEFKDLDKELGFGFLAKYLFKYKKLIW